MQLCSSLSENLLIRVENARQIMVPNGVNVRLTEYMGYLEIARICDPLRFAYQLTIRGFKIPTT